MIMNLDYLKNLNELLYLKPVSENMYVEDFGDVHFTSTSDLIESDLIDGWAKVTATDEYKKHVAIFNVELDTFSIEESELIFIDREEIAKELNNYYKYEKGNTMG